MHSLPGTRLAHHLKRFYQKKIASPKLNMHNACAMGKSIEEDLGAVLRRNRKGADVSMSQVAYEMEISLGYLSDLERGNRTWSEDLVARHNRAVAKLRRKK